MLTLRLEKNEFYDEANKKFVYTPEITLVLEHSLLAVSKWESKYQIPFLSGAQENRSQDQILYYIESMIVKPEDPGNAIGYLTAKEISKVNRYIESKESATTFGEMPTTSQGRGETITSELIYYWMVAFNIPFECERWNLNRLFALIKICNIKNSPKKKMPKHSIAARNRELNQARRAQYNTSG